MRVTSVSTSGLQGQSNKSNGRSNEAVHLSILNIDHKHSHDKAILTRTFLNVCIIFLESLGCNNPSFALPVIPFTNTPAPTIESTVENISRIISVGV